MTTAADTTYYRWRVEQGEDEQLTIPVLDDDDTPFTVAGWTVDAKVKARPGGVVLYTWTSDLAKVNDDGLSVSLTLPASVSAEWTWQRAWYRVKVTDPASDVNDPTVQRILAGPIVVVPD